MFKDSVGNEFSRPEPHRTIPEGSRLIHKGPVFELYNWDQEMFDGSSAIFEGMRRGDAVAVIPVTTEGKILVNKEEQPGMAPFVDVPAGGIDPGEDPLTAAHREFLEETGYKAERMIFFEALQLATTVDWAVYTFFATGCMKVEDVAPSAGEKIETLALSFEEFLQMAGFDPLFRSHQIRTVALRALASEEYMKNLRSLLFNE